MKKVLITAIDSFTGNYLKQHLENSYIVVGTSFKDCDISKKEDILKALKKHKPDYIVHLAGISYVAHDSSEEFYKVNTVGTTNLLDAVLELNLNIEKIVVASSATIYGNQHTEILDESLCPNPVNHYGASKLAMECLAKNYFSKLPIIITRPFNYTGLGQAEHFLIPKIVNHYKNKKNSIELGNLDVKREFNDIRFVCEVYKKLLESESRSEVVNIASENPIALMDIIDIMNKISGYKIEVKVNPSFVRKDEIKTLCGSSKKLFSIVGEIELGMLDDMLIEMLHND